MAVVQRIQGLFIFTVCSSFITVTLSILNLEELQNTKYGIKITSIPVMMREDSQLSNSMLISSKHGQQYQCTLPQLETEETAKDTRTDFTTEEITDLLKLMENRCLYHNRGWWTYEFCYGKSVSQYHEEGNLVVGEKISLGVYSSQTDWSKEKIELPYSKNSSKRFHSQFFENGTKCDLNGELRSAEVKFKCELGSKDHIMMVDEPSSCTYTIIVHTEKLCNHPLFKPAEDRKPLAITCSPALSQDRYEMYLSEIEREKKAKAKVLADKIKKLQELDEDEDNFDDFLEGNRKRKPRRSELWPWNNPGVENNDETWISGSIDGKSMGVTRMDVIKGRKLKNDEDTDSQDRTVTIMSRVMNKDRKPVIKKAETVEGDKENMQKDDVDQKQKEDDSSNAKKEEHQKDGGATDVPTGKDTKEGKQDLATDVPTGKDTKEGKQDLATDVPTGKDTKEGKQDLATDVPTGKDTKEGKQDLATDVPTGKDTKEGKQDLATDVPTGKDTKEGKQDLATDVPTGKDTKEGKQDLATDVPTGKDTKEGKQDEDSKADNAKKEESKDMNLGVFTPTSSSKIVGTVEEDEVGKTSIDGEQKLQEESMEQQSSDTKPKKKRNLEEEWHDALTKARNHFKSVVRKQLKGMGVDPDELEERVKLLKGYNKPKESIADKKKSEPEENELENEKEKKSKVILDPSMDGLKAAVDQKLEKLMQSVSQMEKEGRLEKNSKERRVLTNIKKIMEGMDHQNVLLMKKEETLQRELERHFEELRDRFNMEVTMMKRFIDDIEERGIDAVDGEEDDYLKNIVEKLKKSVLRFDASNKALSKDMEAVKELNREVHSKIDDLVAGDEANRKNKGSDFFRLAAKANLLLRRLLERSAQLDKDMRAMKDVSEDIKARKEEYLDDYSGDRAADFKENAELRKEAELRLGSIVQKLKKMFKGIHEGKFESDAKKDTFGTENPIDNHEKDAAIGPSFGSDNIKVRVTKIKGDDGKTAWSEDDDEEDKGKANAGGEMDIEERLKRASKRMERLVKKQLKNVGISPGGKIRVKIITSRDALENFGGNKGMEVLSEEETNQFKDMIMSLMGGSTEAGNERKRQAELENNYNLVWDNSKMKKAPPDENEEPEAEIVFDDTDVF